MSILFLVASQRSVILGFSTKNDLPTQIHIAQGDNVGKQITFSWVTNFTLTGAVKLGTQSDIYPYVISQSANAESYHFVSKYVGPYDSPYIHFATSPNLNANTVYYYRVGDSTAGWSQEYSFVTPPPVGPEVPFSFAIIGDIGQTVNSTLVRDHVLAGVGFGMAIMAGDLSYADSAWNPNFLNKTNWTCNQIRWDSWGRFIQPLAATLPMMVLAGNHEVELEVGARPPATLIPFLAFQKRFKMPSESCGATNGNLYYSFDVASVHVVMLNSYMAFNSTSDQFAWLVQDFKSYHHNKDTSWLVVSLHAPWYNSNTAHHNEYEEEGMRTAMENLFFENKVDVVFSGHVHAYERSYAVFNNQTTFGAPTYVNIGDGGNREGLAPDYFPQPEWSAYRESCFGHGRLDVLNSTHMEWSWHRVIDQEDVIGDHVSFIKNSFLGHNAAGVTAVSKKGGTEQVDKIDPVHVKKVSV